MTFFFLFRKFDFFLSGILLSLGYAFVTSFRYFLLFLKMKKLNCSKCMYEWLSFQQFLVSFNSLTDNVCMYFFFFKKKTPTSIEMHRIHLSYQRSTRKIYSTKDKKRTSKLYSNYIHFMEEKNTCPKQCLACYLLCTSNTINSCLHYFSK